MVVGCSQNGVCGVNGQSIDAESMSASGFRKRQD